MFQDVFSCNRVHRNLINSVSKNFWLSTLTLLKRDSPDFHFWLRNQMDGGFDKWRKYRFYWWIHRNLFDSDVEDVFSPSLWILWSAHQHKPLEVNFSKNKIEMLTTEIELIDTVIDVTAECDCCDWCDWCDWGLRLAGLGTEIDDCNWWLLSMAVSDVIDDSAWCGWWV